MAAGLLQIDFSALRANWRSLAARSGAATGAVVKADGYGLGIGDAGRALHAEGANTFFVATAEEGRVLRQAVNEAEEIFIFSGHMEGDTSLIQSHALTPLLNSDEQVARHRATLPDAPFGVQLDTGMNRLGMERDQWAEVRSAPWFEDCRLVMSHLACADEPDHPMNPQQLAEFRAMTDGVTCRKSLAATGGILLGAEYHFDLTRPGVGLYGGAPFADAAPVVTLSLPVIQTRLVNPGETVGYGNSWRAERETRLATVAGGYADGIHRALSNGLSLWHDGQPVPVVGRVSMDLITVDVTDLPDTPPALDLLCAAQGVDAVAEAAGTIGYEILTSLGHRYERQALNA